MSKSVSYNGFEFHFYSDFRGKVEITEDTTMINTLSIPAHTLLKFVDECRPSEKKGTFIPDGGDEPRVISTYIQQLEKKVDLHERQYANLQNDRRAVIDSKDAEIEKLKRDHEELKRSSTFSARYRKLEQKRYVELSKEARDMKCEIETLNEKRQKIYNLTSTNKALTDERDDLTEMVSGLKSKVHRQGIIIASKNDAIKELKRANCDLGEAAVLGDAPLHTQIKDLKIKVKELEEFEGLKQEAVTKLIDRNDKIIDTLLEVVWKLAK